MIDCSGVDLKNSVLRFCASVFAMLWTSVCLAQSAGFIVDFNGPKTDLSITRSGNPIDVFLGQELSSGDVITVQNEASLDLHTNGEVIKLDVSNTPTTLDEDEGRSLGDRFSEALAVLAWWDSELQKKPMASRDGRAPFIATLDVAAAPFVLAGDRILRVKWVDGAPPFAIRIETEAGETVSEARTKGNDREYFLNVRLIEGAQYRLSIVGLGKGTEQTTTYEFTAATQDAFDDLAALRNISDTHEFILQALEIAGTENGKYAFETSQQLFELKTSGRLKDVGLAALDFGDWP
ncbi:hypothetical protein [Roseibium sp.]|uniref:hypothetical protein n=1 Tax=Roseibium sp. TaxID=1936156 RepID=UPI003D0A5089